MQYMSLYLQFMSRISSAKGTVAATKSGLVINTLYWASVGLLIVHIFSFMSTVLPCFMVTSEKRELHRFSSRSKIGKKKTICSVIA